MAIIVDRRLFLTADKDELVEENDPRAAFLWAGKGGEVSEDEAERLGYTDGTAKPEDEPSGSGLEIKQEDPPEDKAVKAPESDKTAKPKPRKRAAKRA